MAFRYSAKCNCEKAECAGVATTEADAHRAMDWFEKRHRINHPDLTVLRECYNPDALKEQLDATAAERDGLREEAIECHTENKELRAALDDLFDTHYGMSYHHCGDGDGLSKDDAARIVALVRKIRNE